MNKNHANAPVVHTGLKCVYMVTAFFINMDMYSLCKSVDCFSFFFFVYVFTMCVQCWLTA